MEAGTTPRSLQEDPGQVFRDCVGFCAMTVGGAGQWAVGLVICYVFDAHL